MVVLAVLGSPDVEGILDVCFWIPGPVMHMIWGIEVAVSSGKRFTFLCPVFHKAATYLHRAVSPAGTIAAPIALSRCPSKFGVGLGVGLRYTGSPLCVFLEFAGVW